MGKAEISRKCLGQNISKDEKNKWHEKKERDFQKKFMIETRV